MKAQFDWNEFLKLRRLKLFYYVRDCGDRIAFPTDCLEYIRVNSKNWDGEHLEMALMLLDKVDTPEAKRELVGFLDHPSQHVRLTVIGLLDRMDLDEDLLSSIRGRLLTVDDEFERGALERIEKRWWSPDTNSTS